MNSVKRVISILLAVVMLVATLSACSSSKPCDKCESTPAKAYTNKSTGKKEYYCSDCSSKCDTCQKTATKHYTSGLGVIVFVCDDCYKEIENFNS